jgi:hypothetical protein
MAIRLIRLNFSFLAAWLVAICLAPAVSAQIVNFIPAGVEIDADGVLRARLYDDSTGQLTRQRFEAAQQSLAQDLQTPSELRKVSLNRLEAEIARRLSAGETLDDAIRNLAGLTRITHVFFYPESRDIVVAGPAEGFYMDASGRMVGMKTGQAILQLEDLVVALRAFAPQSASTTLIGCSIDPTKEGLARFQSTVADIHARTASNQVAVRGNEVAIMDALRTALGKQVVSVQGVSPKTHFAKVLVEADYRMKLIGIGLESPPVEMPVWAEKVKPQSVDRNALIRWFFTPDYQRISVNHDETAMQLVGDGVKLITEGERVARDGSREEASADRAAQNYARVFTEKYSEIAERVPVYGQLRNLIDMAIVAAFIKEMDYYGKSGWKASIFGDESKLPVEVHNAPLQVEPMVNGFYKGHRFSTPIGGGVSIQPQLALNADNLQIDDVGTVEQARAAVTLDHLTDRQWWWD